MLYNTALSGEVMQILNHHCHILLDRLGLERKKNEKSSDTLMRGGAFASLGFMGDEEIIEKARSMFEDFVKNKTPIEPNLKSAVMSTVARNGDEKRFDQIKRMYIAERVPEDKIRFLAVLAQFPSKRLIARALSFALSRSVRYQDAELIPAVASSNPLAEEALWKWTSNNWRTLQKRYPAGTMMLKRFVSNLSMQRDSETKKKMVAFFRRKDVATKDIASEVSRTLEKVEANIRLMRLNGLSDE
jgi:aminopeptidase N